jgi:hypothetical protein
MLIAQTTLAATSNNNGVKFNAAPTGNCKVDGNLIVQESGQTPSSSYAGIRQRMGSM